MWGLGFRVWGLGFRVWGLGVSGLGFRALWRSRGLSGFIGSIPFVGVWGSRGLEFYRLGFIGCRVAGVCRV